MEKNSRILIAVSSNRWGGGERHALDLAISLKKSTWIPVLLCPKGPLYQKAVQETIETHEFDFGKRVSFKNICRLYQTIKKLEVCLIHAHLNQACFQTALVAKLLAVSHISTIHGFTTPLYSMFSQKLICVSGAIQKSLPKFLQKKSVLIYNGIPEPSPVIPEKKDKIIGGVFATIHENKGQRFLVESLETIPGLSLLLAGNGNHNDSKILEECIKKSKNPVEWHQEMNTLDGLWEKIDFLIVPSNQEALSYVAIEALSRNIPVLASKTGGLVEIIEDKKTGILFEKRNPAALNTSCKQICKDLELFKKNLANQPFLATHPQFQIQTMTRSIFSVYKSLLAST